MPLVDIQTIRDSQGGGGQQSVIFNSDLKAFRSKKSSLREQDKVLKDTFILIHFLLQCREVLENSYLKKEMSHRGGGMSEKCQKSVTYYLNGPLKATLYFYLTLILFVSGGCASRLLCSVYAAGRSPGCPLPVRLTGKELHPRQVPHQERRVLQRARVCRRLQHHQRAEVFDIQPRAVQHRERAAVPDRQSPTMFNRPGKAVQHCQ